MSARSTPVVAGRRPRAQRCREVDEGEVSMNDGDEGLAFMDDGGVARGGAVGVHGRR
jgi:hypothetical protein